MADWDERYRRGEHASLEPNHLLVRAAAESQTAGRALDLACGAGRHALLLARRGWRVTAVDRSGVGIEIMRERARAAGLSIDARPLDLERGEFRIEPETYDLICDFYYLQRDLWPQIRAGLRRDGTFVAAIHLADAGNETGNPSFLLQPGELRSEFSDWQILHYHETEREDADAGRHHRRTAELIARRPPEL
jgi:SAM-dependent methyltransferase